MVVRVVVFLFLVLCVPLRAHANYVGLNGLAGMNPRFPCDAFVNTINTARNPVFTVLWDSSFGSSKECLKTFMASNAHRDHAVLVYLGNGNGRHDGTLEPGDFWQGWSCGIMNRLIAERNPYVRQSYADRLQEAMRFFAAFGSVHTQVVIVPELEDCFDSAAWAELGAFLQTQTHFVLARNPSTGSKEQGGAWFVEKHGKGAKCAGGTQIANLDGDTLGKSSTAKWFRTHGNCWMMIGYVPEIQGRGKNGSFKGGRFDRKFTVPSGWDSVLGQF